MAKLVLAMGAEQNLHQIHVKLFFIPLLRAHTHALVLWNLTGHWLGGTKVALESEEEDFLVGCVGSRVDPATDALGGFFQGFVVARDPNKEFCALA